ncbi:hypothetical protein BB560_004632, partial [Smittium megazygosporum]
MNDFKKYQSSKGRATPTLERSDTQDPEQNEDEEVDMIKSRIAEVKQDSLNSTRNALRQVRQTQETASNTMNKLGEQTSQLNRIDKTLEVANVQAGDSVDKTQKLRTLNRSIFSISIGNPFSSKKKKAAELEKAKQEHQKSVEESERLRQINYESQKRVQDAKRNPHAKAGYELSEAEQLDVQNDQLNRIQGKADDTSAKIAVSQHHLRKI